MNLIATSPHTGDVSVDLIATSPHTGDVSVDLIVASPQGMCQCGWVSGD